MTRIRLALVLPMIACVTLPAPAAERAARPNFVFILVGDLRYDQEHAR